MVRISPFVPLSLGGATDWSRDYLAMRIPLTIVRLSANVRNKRRRTDVRFVDSHGRARIAARDPMIELRAVELHTTKSRPLRSFAS